MKLLKKLGQVLNPINWIGAALGGTGKSAAKRAANAAEAYSLLAIADREKAEANTAKERKRAQKLSIRGMRSKRAASYFSQPIGGGEGSSTIG